MNWQPTNVRRFIEGIGTSTRVMRVETDAGEGFLKALGNPEGPHALASEWVGTQLAHLLGLPTFEYAIVDVAKDDELPFQGGGRASPGPAFISRAERGTPWGGDAQALHRITNPDDVARLVVLDTWLRNRDRHSTDDNGRARVNYDNVWLSREGMSGKKFLLKAIDHTHCFASGGTLTTRLAHLDCIQDEAIYGLFPQFREMITEGALQAACDRLRGLQRAQFEPIVRAVPAAWAVATDVRVAWVELIERRAPFVADTIRDSLFGQGQLEL
jgi:hypothetical protein